MGGGSRQERTRPAIVDDGDRYNGTSDAYLVEIPPFEALPVYEG